MISIAVSCLTLFIQTSSWTSYTSSAGKYSADFPGKVQTVARPVPTEAGNIQMYSAFVDMGPKAFMMMYNDYPRAGNPALVLPAVWNGQVKGKQDLKVLSKNMVKYQGKSAIEGTYQYSTNGRQTTTRVRLILSGKRLYQQMAISIGSSIDKVMADRFFKSLRLR